jgi:hypothetical protein
MQPGWVNSKNCVQKTLHCFSCMTGGFPSGSPLDGFCFIFFTSIFHDQGQVLSPHHNSRTEFAYIPIVNFYQSIHVGVHIQTTR